MSSVIIFSEMTVHVFKLFYHLASDHPHHYYYTALTRQTSVS